MPTFDPSRLQHALDVRGLSHYDAPVSRDTALKAIRGETISRKSQRAILDWLSRTPRLEGAELLAQ